MTAAQLPVPVAGSHIYMVGIKGTGMAALTEMMTAKGAIISGSDTAETFYTDAILASLDVHVFEGFDSTNIPDVVDAVIYSAAYDPDSHVELVEV